MLEVLENPQVTEMVMTLSDVARELGVSRQAILNRKNRGTLPEPDYQTVNGSPMWKRHTLEKAGILQ